MFFPSLRWKIGYCLLKHVSGRIHAVRGRLKDWNLWILVVEEGFCLRYYFGDLESWHDSLIDIWSRSLLKIVVWFLWIGYQWRYTFTSWFMKCGRRFSSIHSCLVMTPFWPSMSIFIIFQPLARMGASVTGVDAVEKNIKIAQLHAVCVICIMAMAMVIVWFYDNACN